MDLTPKASEIVEVAHHLFWKFGIKRVSVKEICEQAQCSKMTFYRHFDNKTDIAKEVLRQLISESHEKYQVIMNKSTSFSEKIHEIIVLQAEQTETISAEFFQDILSGNESELETFLHSLSQKFHNLILIDFKKAQKNGDIRKDLNIEFALHFSDKLSAMITDPELQAHFDTTQELIVEITNLFFYGIGTKESS